jgi:hypothetical protein
VAVVPGDEEGQLVVESPPVEGNDDSAGAFVFERPDESFDDRQATVLADGPESLPDAFRRHQRRNPLAVNCLPWSVIRYFGPARARRITRSRNDRRALEEGGVSKTANPMTRRE